MPPDNYWISLGIPTSILSAMAILLVWLRRASGEKGFRERALAAHGNEIVTAMRALGYQCGVHPLYVDRDNRPLYYVGDGLVNEEDVERILADADTGGLSKA